MQYKKKYDNGCTSEELNEYFNQLGVSSRTVQYWKKIGKIPYALEKVGRIRKYTPEQLKQIYSKIIYKCTIK